MAAGGQILKTTGLKNCQTWSSKLEEATAGNCQAGAGAGETVSSCLACTGLLVQPWVIVSHFVAGAFCSASNIGAAAAFGAVADCCLPPVRLPSPAHAACAAAWQCRCPTWGVHKTFLSPKV